MRIHLVSARKSNYPWGIGNLILDGLKSLGHEVIDTDFRTESEILSQRLESSDVDFTLFLNGTGIPLSVISKCKSKKVLWHGELLSFDQTDQVAKTKENNLVANIKAFDVVFHNDLTKLSIVKGLGAKSARSLYTAIVDPKIHKKLNIPKRFDVGMIGNLSDRRKVFLNNLKQKFSIQYWYEYNLVNQNKFINECKMILNIHYTTTPNIETRTFETLGAGTFLLAEKLSENTSFIDKTHFVSWENDPTEKIDYYLKNEVERERIAKSGFEFVHANHTVELRLKQLIGEINE